MIDDVHITSRASAAFGHLDYQGWTWQTEQQSETQSVSVRAVFSSRWECEWWCLECNWPKMVWNFICLHAPRKTVTRAGGMSGWDRQAGTVPCCPTFSSIYELLPAVSGHVKLWPISLHLLEGWPGKPTTLLCFGSQSHVCRHLCIWSPNADQECIFTSSACSCFNAL